ncbi:MAG: DUF3887 domain-containing protein [Planctomycetota bacterium]
MLTTLSLASFFLVWTSSALAEDPVQEDAIRTATQFMQHVADGQYKEACDMFHGHLRQTMSQTELESMWVAESRSLGPFVGLGPANVITKEGEVAVQIQCAWQKAPRTLIVTLNQDKKIVGVQWVPHEDPAKAPQWTQPPVPPSVKELEVTVGKEPWLLPGTLTLPANTAVRAGIVFIHDSGPQNRDGNTGVNTPFRDLAHGLGGKGIATLRYEKRTRQFPEKMAEKPYTAKEEFIEDGLEALRAIRERPELEAVHIYLAGFGRGATHTPEIAERDGQVAGMILLGPSGRSTEESLQDQLDYGETLYGDPGAKEMISQIREKLHALRTRTLGADDNLYGLPNTYWYDLCDRDAEIPIQKAASFPGRILVVNCGRDYGANLEDHRLWQLGLSKHPDATFKFFEDLNRAFGKGKSKATPMEYFGPRPVDPAVIGLIGGWCLQAATKSADKKP